jgi:SAM-dependent methyltransferase
LRGNVFNFALTANQRGGAVAKLMSRAGSLRGKRYLDAGCAYGGFLVAFGEFGARPIGIELDETLLNLAKENFCDFGVDYPLLQGDITNERDVARLGGPFDIITCNDVIEHVADPELTIRHISNLLTEDGLAYFEIPNAEAVSAVRSDGHYQLFALTLLEKAEAVEYFHSVNPGVAYGVEHMLSLEQYRHLMKANGLYMDVLEESFDLVDVPAIKSELAALARNLPVLVSMAPKPLRDRVEKAVITYLKEASAAASHARPDPEHFLLRYGVGFWKILARKRSTKTLA